MKFDSIEEEIIYKNFTENLDNNNMISYPSLNNQDRVSQIINHNNLNIGTLENTFESTSYRPISSFHKKVKGIVIFIKRIQRKLLKWYIEPICTQQTIFNGAVLNMAKDSRDIQIEILNKLQQLSSQNDILEGKLINCEEHIKLKENQNLELENRNLELEKRISDLENIQKMELQKVLNTENKLKALDELKLGIFDNVSTSFWDKNTLSQSGEDAIISFATMALGIPLAETTYLDLGANHAKELSNTYFFYKNGARGILVEANPDLIPELKFYRNGDIILNRCISNENGEIIPFYIINGDGLSTLNKESAEDAISKNPDLEITQIIDIETITVNTIMEQYFGKAPVILNIDLEGIEMMILRSIDFDKFRPLVIITEMIPYETHLVIEKKNVEIVEFMKLKGYIEYAFSGINSIFMDKSQVEDLI